MTLIQLPKSNLDDSIPTPLYFQLQQLIEETIRGGNYGSDYKLPSERDLAVQFGLSRMTVRQATNALVNQGLLVRRRGMGTYVSPPKMEQGLLRLSSFTQDMKQMGMEPSTRILKLDQGLATADVAKGLGIPEGAKVNTLERLRFADGVPMAYECCHLPTDFGCLTDLQENSSLYELLKVKHGIKLAKARQSLEATVATKHEAELLKVVQGAPLLLLVRSTLDQRGRPIEYVRSLYRADRYKFYVQLFR